MSIFNRLETSQASEKKQRYKAAIQLDKSIMPRLCKHPMSTVSAERISIIIEYENASTHREADIKPILLSLLRQHAGETARELHELIFVFDGTEQLGNRIQKLIDATVPKLRHHFTVTMLARRGLCYYELKNAAAAIARGDILVFLDSDALPEDGWLHAIVAPFQRAETRIVNGYTYLEHHDFLSRTLALTWIFPLRHDDRSEAARRSLNANNFAARREWFNAQPFEGNVGFKVSCSLMVRRLKQLGIPIVDADAYARHQSFANIPFLLWRATAAGRDDDIRYATTRTQARAARVTRALTRWLHKNSRALKRIVLRHHDVGLPRYQIPAAIVVAWSYFTLALVFQLASAFRPPRNHALTIPHHLKTQRDAHADS